MLSNQLSYRSGIPGTTGIGIILEVEFKTVEMDGITKRLYREKRRILDRELGNFKQKIKINKKCLRERGITKDKKE